MLIFKIYIHYNVVLYIMLLFIIFSLIKQMKRRANVFSKFIVASLRDLLIDFRVGRGYNIVALLGDPPKVWSSGWIVVCLANSHFDVVDSGVALNSSNLKERCWGGSN